MYISHILTVNFFKDLLALYRKQKGPRIVQGTNHPRDHSTMGHNVHGTSQLGRNALWTIREGMTRQWQKNLGIILGFSTKMSQNPSPILPTTGGSLKLNTRNPFPEYHSECTVGSEYHSECTVESDYHSECTIGSEYPSECTVGSENHSECTVRSEYNSECTVGSELFPTVCHGKECALK